ncbi:hypothetical protein QE152_g19593 [Popillia japonica]|uniref:Uncharacterized protein n=1 Tax=Popillia japonica TaxID=7064 RepID=A0AAW1KSR4_POPJA
MEMEQRYEEARRTGDKKLTGKITERTKCIDRASKTDKKMEKIINNKQESYNKAARTEKMVKDLAMGKGKDNGNQKQTQNRKTPELMEINSRNDKTNKVTKKKTQNRKTPELMEINSRNDKTNKVTKKKHKKENTWAIGTWNLRTMLAVDIATSIRGTSSARNEASSACPRRSFANAANTPPPVDRNID